MNLLNIGDVVRLKSGGPFMTVVAISGPKAECAWFVNDQVFTAFFVFLALETKNDVESRAA